LDDSALKSSSSSTETEVMTGEQPEDDARAVQLTFDEKAGKFVLPPGACIRLKVKPEEGMAIVFNHNMFHCGETLSHGEKWVLRSDVLFEQVWTNS
jgi:hypothetical protein